VATYPRGPFTFELASGAATGTISNIGTSFTGFGTITVDQDANWTVLSAVNSITMAPVGSVTGTSTIELDSGSRMLFSAGVAATAPIRFDAADATLAFADPAAVAATTYGFQPGGTIDFTTITSSASIIAGVNASPATAPCSARSSAIRLRISATTASTRHSTAPPAPM
jgi:hypothetical protein